MSVCISLSLYTYIYIYIYTRVSVYNIYAYAGIGEYFYKLICSPINNSINSEK